MSISDTDSASARAFVALQYLLPQHLLSALMHQLARSRLHWLKNAFIGAFLQLFGAALVYATISDRRERKRMGGA